MILHRYPMAITVGMGCSTACPGLCCLVLDEASRTVKVHLLGQKV